MDTSSVGFEIPSFIDIITFIFFQLWPATIFVSLILYGILKRFLPKITHPIRAVFFIFSTIFTIYFLFEAFIKNAGTLSVQYFLILGIFVLISIVFSLICVFPITLFTFFLKKNRLMGLIVILLFASLLLALYPKLQHYPVVEGRRIAPVRDCMCLGFSEKKSAEFYGASSYTCFGILYSCTESVVDRCPDLPIEARCFADDNLDYNDLKL